ncbi:uncharacterized protein JCM15063_006208 [Sporobolomyces koalae]|uniref:uncharacterized protein n=1 Tax=Sporobolomyces koalae TaxID=500713 RepID=UPI00317BBF23
MISTFENLTDAVGKSIEPCFSNKRQLVKCIVDRDSPAVEIVNAFTLLIPDVLASEEQGLLIAADIHRLVEKESVLVNNSKMLRAHRDSHVALSNSRELRLHITTSLAKAALKDGVESAERLASLTRFLQQLATMIILIVKPPDLKDFTALLDVIERTIWLRLMIVTLLEREPKDAFQYLENAKQLVQDNLLTYPAEELSWLISTAWDQGIEIYSACRPDDPALDGLEWCLIAFELANLSSDHMLAHQLGGWIDKLKQGRVARSNDSQLHEETAPGAEDDVFMDQTS